MQTMRRGGVVAAAKARDCSDSSAGKRSGIPEERRKWRRLWALFMGIGVLMRLTISRETKDYERLRG